ncbi:DNA polymerase III subunit beta [Chlamydia trachomatis]|nr:DNA polymerase III subunit beta [Chlamydia trachomatis]
MLNALRRVSVFTSSSGLVKFELKPGEIFMSTQDVDYSTSAEEKIACDYNSDELSIGFNDSNIIDVLNNIKSETVTLKLMDASKAGIFVPVEQEEDCDLLILLMPMML